MDYEEDSRIAFKSHRESMELREHVNRQMRYSLIMSITAGAIGGLCVWACIAYWWLNTTFQN